MVSVIALTELLLFHKLHRLPSFVVCVYVFVYFFLCSYFIIDLGAVQVRKNKELNCHKYRCNCIKY